MMPHGLRVMLATAPVDMRRSIDGLARLVVEQLGEDPRATSSLFVFVNTRRDRLKALWRDKTGWCLLYKRLDENIVVLPEHIEAGASSVTVDARALARLLDGAPPIRREPAKEIARKSREAALSTMEGVSTKKPRDS